MKDLIDKYLSDAEVRGYQTRRDAEYEYRVLAAKTDEVCACLPDEYDEDCACSQPPEEGIDR